MSLRRERLTSKSAALDAMADERLSERPYRDASCASVRYREVLSKQTSCDVAISMDIVLRAESGTASTLSLAPASDQMVVIRRRAYVRRHGCRMASALDPAAR